MERFNAVAVILGGGEGSRLQPLTKERAKPAVPLAGKYRLVDIPISNCLNSHIRKIYLLTQFNSVSLHQHVQSSYNFDQFHQGFVRIMAAQQTPKSNAWFHGTADAVRQVLGYLEDTKPDFVVVLSGDQLYRMDFVDVLRKHIENKAELTITTKPVDRAETLGLGIMQVDAAGRINDFVEKPTRDEQLEPLRAPMYENERYLASMGIYVFNTKTLIHLLDNDQKDFGHDIIPGAIKDHRVFSYIFDGYWKDIGTVGAFWEANLALTDPLPEFSFYDSDSPIFTHMRYLPPSKINCCDLNRCLLAEGCVVSGHRILHSVIGIRAVIGDGTVIENSVVMGADYYENEAPAGLPKLGIGRDCYISRAIIDKNARIGDGCYITPDGKPDPFESDLYTVRDGVICIPKTTVLPAGTRL
ncbi:MAG: glucose-1-phosphate adenylyltransferase [Spartobacteria bacterium]|nr:glucose-1-phosphate adenylyltransferase [Spartobacteria bacterium]